MSNGMGVLNDTQTTIILAATILALAQIIAKVIDWKLGERRRNGRDSVQSSLDVRLDIIEANAIAMRLTLNDVQNTITQLARQGSNLAAALDEDAKHMRASLHTIANALNPLAGWIKELRDQARGQ